MSEFFEPGFKSMLLFPVFFFLVFWFVLQAKRIDRAYEERRRKR